MQACLVGCSSFEEYADVRIEEVIESRLLMQDMKKQKIIHTTSYEQAFVSTRRNK
jgi:hypothetical protein